MFSLNILKKRKGDKRLMIPDIAPFPGLRYDPRKTSIKNVVAPPYDVISADLQKKLYNKDSHNVVRLILGNQFPEDTEKNNRYTRAAADLEKWMKEGVLVQDTQPSLYLYEQVYESAGSDGKKVVRVRRGFLAAKRLEEFGKGKVMPHEKTLSGPKVDRLLLTRACRANLSPIFALYSDPEKKAMTLLQNFFHTEPMIDFIDEEGIRQRFWSVQDRELFLQINEILSKKKLFIADGHHRYETAITYRNEIKTQQGNSLDESSSLNYVMMFFSEMSDPGLVILPTHRVLKNWPGFNGDYFKKKLKEIFVFRKEQEEQSLGLLLPPDRDLYFLTLKKEHMISVLADLPEPLRGVDTAILHQVIFKKILGMKEEDEKNLQILSFIKNREEALSFGHHPETNAVFLLNSSKMKILERVVEAGLILPPKTTYFYPKLLSGLVMHPLDPERRVVI